MTFEELMEQFKPGMVARRPTWDQEFTVEMRDDQVRLYSKKSPKLNPVWRKAGYDALSDDYYFC